MVRTWREGDCAFATAMLTSPEGASRKPSSRPWVWNAGQPAVSMSPDDLDPRYLRRERSPGLLTKTPHLRSLNAANAGGKDGASWGR